MANMNIAKKQPQTRPLPAIPNLAQIPIPNSQPKAQAPATNVMNKVNTPIQNRLVNVPKQPAPKAAMVPIAPSPAAEPKAMDPFIQSLNNHLIEIEDLKKRDEATLTEHENMRRQIALAEDEMTSKIFKIRDLQKALRKEQDKKWEDFYSRKFDMNVYTQIANDFNQKLDAYEKQVKQERDEFKKRTKELHIDYAAKVRNNSN